MTNQAIPAWAVPGARVVCVNGVVTGLNVASLQTNGVYVLRSVFRTYDHSYEKILVRLRGVTNDVADSGLEKGYWLSRFRPATEAKTQAEDVALFENIVRGMPLVERLDRIAETLDA